MTERSARDLLERLRTDEAFRDRIMAEHGPDARLVLVRAEGFDCTAEEIAALAVRLPDEALEAVAAGLALPCGAYGEPDQVDPFKESHVI